MAPKRWRKRRGSDCWHFVTTCRWWPEDDSAFVERTKKPTSGDLCNQCKAKARRMKETKGANVD